MFASDDSYDNPFHSITEEDLAEIDLLVRGSANDSASTVVEGGPRILIEVENENRDANKVEKPPADDMVIRIPAPSPFQRFRWKSRSFSVSDLVSPVWSVYVQQLLNEF